jgi:signal transduction histidine kinase
MPDVLIPFLLVGPILLLLALGIVTILIREQRRRLVQEKEKQQILAQQNEQLEQQVAARTAEIIAQRNDLEQALTDLKTTQTQLVQREKMASLGELTAGIAHEMQNPLNFVTNFSDLSVDLVAELEEELAKEHLSPEGKLTIYQLVQDLIENQSRIHQHGHRADRIVKSMLEHSRASSGQRQATNLNALVDESLRLAYHGWRAKSKDSNATLLTELEPNLEPVWVLPQDLNRVLLNLLTNAFYAVAEKSRQLGEAYRPEVCVQTRRVGHTVQIRVRDNGNGIPEAVRDKIFQPFFTTKPTGEGTGLGLSLSYDIITKGHGGTLSVASKDGEYTEFTIGLPIRATERD